MSVWDKKTDMQKVKAAKVALKKFNSEGFALDSEDMSHVNAYLALRPTAQRLKASQVQT